jgi:hypothetical protein
MWHKMREILDSLIDIVSPATLDQIMRRAPSSSFGFLGLEGGLGADGVVRVMDVNLGW